MTSPGNRNDSILKLEGWLSGQDFKSFDPYDLWGSRYGVWAKGLYHKNHLAGAPFAASIFAAEILAPGVRRFFIPKRSFATSHAHLILGYSNLYELTRNKTYLDKAETLAGKLLEMSIPGYSGLCWGYPFDWPTNRGMWPANTPMITATPYCFEACLRLYDLTGKQVYLSAAELAARFAEKDLHDTVTSEKGSACSYTPIDRTQVVNVNAYRAWMLVEAYRRFGNEACLAKAVRNIAFILESQQADGSWLYALGNPQDAFIDHFHTCFVLKNLAKMNVFLGREDIRAVIDKGYAYYRKHLFYTDGTPKPFTHVKRFQPVRIEIYDYAEDVMLGAVLGDSVPGAVSFAGEKAEELIRRFQHPAGFFYTRVYAGGIKHSLPYIRWPQSQLLNSLSTFQLKAPDRTGSPGPEAEKQQGEILRFVQDDKGGEILRFVQDDKGGEILRLAQDDKGFVRCSKSAKNSTLKTIPKEVKAK